MKYQNKMPLEPRHKISNNVVCATSKASDQPAHMRRLIRAFISRLIILWLLSYWPNIIEVSKLKRKLHMLVWVYTCENTKLLEITCHGSLNRFSTVWNEKTTAYAQKAPTHVYTYVKSRVKGLIASWPFTTAIHISIGLNIQGFQREIVNTFLPLIFSICCGCLKEPFHWDDSC